MSVFLWRLISNRIPVDTKLQWRKVSLASKCRCCSRPRVESVPHLFIQGEGANTVWRYFADWFPDSQQQLNLDDSVVNRLRVWGSDRPSTSKLHIRCLIPCLIMWFLWTERNCCVHRSVIFRPQHVIWLVKAHLHSLIMTKIIDSADWSGCSPRADFMERIPPRRRITKALMVKWEPPDQNWLKLNTDGAFEAVSGKAGGGGVIRDHHGDIVRAFCLPIDASSSWEAELLAVRQGVTTAMMLGSSIWIELDAMVIVHLLNSGERGPARF